MELYQWLLLLLFGGGFLLSAPLARGVSEFFSAEREDGSRPNGWVLTSSLVISWIFAKSITNAANLGLSFGLVGGFAYAVYYGSFLVAGVVIYQLRTRGGFRSIHHFLHTRYGRSAVVVFSLLVGFRLFNEVWSNTMVIGSYFGAAGSAPYYWSILVFTGLTLAYTLKGGLRSSLLTDAVQMLLFGGLLVLLLTLIVPRGEASITAYLGSGTWRMETGLNLALVALLQIFSYPFHDSVLTDRGFIADPKTTLRSYFWAGGIGFVCILLFSFIGIYARLNGLQGQAAVAVSQQLGILGALAMNFIMITSAASTLDSAFSSFSKLVVIDLGVAGARPVRTGRLVMAGLTVLGTLPIFFDPEILSATTVSGTMVMGLAPVFLAWRTRGSFHAAVGTGIVLGVFHASGWLPTVPYGFPGKYGDLLAVNLWGLALCIAAFYSVKIFSLGKKHS